MSLRAPLLYQIPEQTAQVARAAFPKGNPYIHMRDERGPSLRTQTSPISSRKTANWPPHPRTNSTHVLAAIHGLNRFDRYRRAVNEYRLPKGQAARYELAAQLGTDGREVLTHLDDPRAPTWLGEIPAVRVLRQVWTQQFYAVAPDALMRWRIAPGPGADHDPEARYRKKRETEWVGSKVHLTETSAWSKPGFCTC